MNGNGTTPSPKPVSATEAPAMHVGLMQPQCSSGAPYSMQDLHKLAVDGVDVAVSTAMAFDVTYPELVLPCATVELLLEV